MKTVHPIYIEHFKQKRRIQKWTFSKVEGPFVPWRGRSLLTFLEGKKQYSITGQGKEGRWQTFAVPFNETEMNQ